MGHIGSGKTTFLGWKAQETHQIRPQFPTVSNLPIKFPDGSSVYYQEDILKWLALKLIKRDLTPMELYVDEAAQAGLESRGSGLKSTDSRLITLARKANVHLFLASQLMSMMDKRAQWNWDFAVDCEAHYVTEESMASFMPDYFTYGIYDSDFRFQKTLTLFGDDAAKRIFPMFDTMQVPLRTLLEMEFKQYYWGDGHKGVNEEAFEQDSVEFDKFIRKIRGRVVA